MKRGNQLFGFYFWKCFILAVEEFAFLSGLGASVFLFCLNVLFRIRGKILQYNL